MGVRLKWKNNSLGDSNTIYRSSLPMSPNALPEPLVTIDGSATSYDDLSAARDEPWFYRIEVARGPTKALSDEVSIDPSAASDRKPGNGRIFNGDDYLQQTSVAGFMPNVRTFLIDFMPTEQPAPNSWQVLINASYDGSGVPFVWAASDYPTIPQYGAMGCYRRESSGIFDLMLHSSMSAVIGQRQRLIMNMVGPQPASISENGAADIWINNSKRYNQVPQSLMSMPDRIGKASSFNLPFKGRVYAVAFWNRSLTEAEIGSIMLTPDYDLNDYPGLTDAWLPKKLSAGVVPNEVTGRPAFILME